MDRSLSNKSEFDKFISVSNLFLKIVNLPSGIIGGIWLLSLGNWKIVVVSFLATVTFLALYGTIYRVIAFLLSFSIPHSTKGEQRMNMLRDIRVLTITALTLFWTMLVIAGVFTLSGSISLFPLLLVGYSVVTGSFAAVSLRQAEFKAPAYAAVYLSQISFILISALLFFDLNDLLVPLAAILGTLFVLHAFRIGHLVSGNVRRLGR